MSYENEILQKRGSIKTEHIQTQPHQTAFNSSFLPTQLTQHFKSPNAA